jgi:glycosyltransferase involved in cell wall biosynthesis
MENGLQASRVHPSSARTARVLLVDLARAFGGIEVRVLQIARALAGRRPVTVAALAGGPLAERLRAEGLPTLEIPFHRWNPRIVPALARGLVGGGFAVVDCHNHPSHLWGTLAVRDAAAPRLVTTVHAVPHEAQNAGRLAPLYSLVPQLARRRGARFIAISERVRGWLLNLGVAADRVRLIPGGIEVPPPPTTERITAVRTALGLAADDFVVAVVARLVGVKAHGVMTAAVAMLAGGRPRLRCLYVGDGPERGAIERDVAERRLAATIRCLGFRTDVADIVGASDLVCLPSLAEGLPYAVLEAAALARPLVVSAVGGLAENFRHGETARLVPPGDAEALARELAWAMDHGPERTELGAAARRLIEERFAVAGMVAATEAEYEAAARG